MHRHYSFFVFAVFWATFCFVASAAPADVPRPRPPVKKCSNPIVRKEWRRMSKPERKNYIAAIQCLLKTPARYPKSLVPGGVSRYDDLVATHVLQLRQNHGGGRFLPWHRWYIHSYEKMLREDCGYKGAQPYWDWTLDAEDGKFTKSPIFDPVYGFGGNGPFIPTPADVPPESLITPDRSGGGCVLDGPFTNMTVYLGPNGDLNGTPRCLSRDISPTFGIANTKYEVLNRVVKAPTYWTMDLAMEGDWLNMMPLNTNVHAGGHFSIGGLLGIMGDFTVSVGDPLFWLHHTNLDRTWWSWQSLKPSVRLAEVDGPLMMWDYQNLEAGNATLDTVVDVGVSAGPISIYELMDIENIHLCYKYDQLYTPRP